MRKFELRKETLINAPLDEIWKFFCNPHNLQSLCPDYMRFIVKSCPDTDVIYNGMQIEYRVSPLLGIPLKWLTEIKEVENKTRFKDIQLQGPFSLWEHTHLFQPVSGGILMTDIVAYLPPMGVLGRAANFLFIQGQLESIFSYREEVINNLFNNGRISQ